MNCFSLIAMGCVLGQAMPDDAERAREVEAWRASLDGIATEHRIAPDGPSAAPFRRVEDPVFAWNQPVRRGQIGSVYLWLQKDGRPGAIGTVFCWYRWKEYWAIMHEFHSLAETPLKASFRGQEVWTPAQAGLKWRPLPIETPVASSRTRQLSQIRQISRRFRAHTLKPEGERWQLRLLPRPLYEYSTNSDDSVRVGAVLALCQDMDPEIILVIEARAVKDGLAWHYACGSFTDYESHLSFGDQEVWHGLATADESELSPRKAYWRKYITKRALPPRGKGQPATWTE